VLLCWGLWHARRSFARLEVDASAVVVRKP